MVRACVVFGIGAVAGALLIDSLIPGVFGDYPLVHAITVLATAEQQVADMLSRNQGMKYRVLIADDHAIMREGVRALLLSDGGIEVVAAVDNGRDAVRLAVTLKPDLAVMELTMPQMDGLSAIRELVHRAVPTRVLVLTRHKTEEHVRASLKGGGVGLRSERRQRGRAHACHPQRRAGQEIRQPRGGRARRHGLPQRGRLAGRRRFAVRCAHATRKGGSQADRWRTPQP